LKTRKKRANETKKSSANALQKLLCLLRRRNIYGLIKNTGHRYPGQIYNWRRQYNRLSEKQVNSIKGVDYSKDESEELRKLRREIVDLKEENEFLKKTTAYFSKPNW